MQKQIDPTKYNWLSVKDEGKLVIVTGHYTGDFIGTVAYGGCNMAIVTDMDGNNREVCYMKPVKFEFVEVEVKHKLFPKIDDNDIPF